MDSGRIPCLDGLRALSLLLVLVAHASRTPGFPFRDRGSEMLIMLGPLGVKVFFVISGFLITLLLLRERQRTGQISLKGFYLRRSLRIMPPFAAYLLVMGLMAWAGWVRLGLREWFLSALYTTGMFQGAAWEVGHLWSLALEEQFYLVWPALFVLLPLKLATRLAGLFFLACAAVAFWVPNSYEMQANGFHYLWFVPAGAIGAGCVLAVWAHGSVLGAWTERMRPRLPLLAGLCLLGLPLMVALSKASYRFRSVQELVEGLLIAALVWLVCNSANSTLGRFLESRQMVGLGLLSYSLYLWQQPFLHWRSDALVCQWPLNLLLALGAGLASYHLLERPLLSLRQRVREAEEPSAPPLERLPTITESLGGA